MQKIILLLPLVCLVFCTAQESEIQSLIYTHTHKVDIVQRISTDSYYLCPVNYAYLVRDFQIFNGIVCVHTIITDIQLQQGECSPGWVTVSENEVVAHQPKYCKMLRPRDIARIGFMGSLSGYCSLSEFDTTSIITHSLCVKRMIDDVQLVPRTDNICGEGMVLVTPQEALANLDNYCGLLINGESVRLADGGAMDGAGYIGSGCSVRYEDTRDLGAALCRTLKNSEPNENEEMFIPEATFNLEQHLEFQGGWI